MLAHQARVLIATMWAGSLWTIGYMVAPALFSALHDRALAGTIAGQLFRTEAWLSVACAAALFILLKFGNFGENAKQQRNLFAIVSAMLACTLIGYFGLQPFMAELREAARLGGAMDSDARMKFGVLHGISAVIYLLQSLLGVALVLKIR